MAFLSGIRLGFGSGFMLAVIGLVVTYILAGKANHNEAEAERIEYRITFYKSVGADLNSLYAFVCRVGDYSLTSPSAAGASKLKMDADFVINIPLMSAKTYNYYQKFISTFIESSRVEGTHFRFRMKGDTYAIAYRNRRKENLDRGGPAAGAMAEVSDSELHEWFAADAKLRSADQVRDAYADLLHSFSEDRGFGSAKVDPSQLTCLQ
ncbi:MAG: hypothetical protein M3Z96_08400 [Pseudomonadota bacterium]|nr:hypothetical protein [Pseudomonadota bacterium]